jgi:ribose 5-phosphate isomerase B
MKIFIGADHAGFTLKGEIILFLENLGYEIEDKGADDFNADDDYPDFISQVAKEVAADNLVKGIIIGGSGQGEAITANRFKGVRAAVYYGGNMDLVKLSREHNNANILSLGARFMTTEEAKDAIKLWLDTPFSNDERHIRRLAKIDQIK